MPSWQAISLQITCIIKTISFFDQKFQARNKPADGSTPRVAGQKSAVPGKGGPAKATAHSAKNPAPAKQAVAQKQGGSKGSASPPKPVAAAPGKTQKKKKNQQHDLIVTINLVSYFCILF